MNLPGIYKIFKWEELQSAYIISDPHFGDASIPKAISDDEIVANINKYVGKKDLLICLGDVGDVEYARKLRGYKVLVCGNHDLGATNYERRVLQFKYDKDKITKEEIKTRFISEYPGWSIQFSLGVDPAHAPFEYWLITLDNKLFDEVYTGPLTISEKVILSHEPIKGCPWWMNLHGHVHTNTLKSAQHINCCLDANNYQPLSLNKLFKNGISSQIQSLHRETIDKATKRKRKRKA